MSIERSHGRARPTLPRASDLAVPQPPHERRLGRDAHGRFAAGNASGRGRGWKRAVRELAPPGTADATVRQLAGDAASLYRARLAELPHTGPTVSALVAESSRSAVLSADFAARAVAAGLDTPAGRSLLETSMKLGQRAERTSVTALDLATRFAAARAASERPDWRSIFAAPPPPEPADDAPDDAPEADEESSPAGRSDPFPKAPRP